MRQTRVGSDVTLVCWGQWARALSHSQRARGDKAVDFAFAQTELAKHCVVVFALEGRITGGLELFAGEMQRTAGQAVGSSVAVRDFLDRAPIFRPFHLGQLLQERTSPSAVWASSNCASRAPMS